MPADVEDNETNAHQNRDNYDCDHDNGECRDRSPGLAGLAVLGPTDTDGEGKE